MSNFGLDNTGSGFAIDDDEDLGDMFNKAASSAEDSGDDVSSFQSSSGKDSTHATYDDSDDETSATPPLEELMEDFPEITEDPAPAVAEEPEPEPEPEPTPEPEFIAPVAPTPVREQPASPRAGARVKVPTEAEQVSDAARIIRVLDTYRSLSKEEKSVTIQFVSDGELEEAEDSVVVIKVLNADSQLNTSMRALREAWESDPVERAFYTIGLSRVTLLSLGDLVSVFSGDDFDSKLTDLAYSREVVSAIAKLGEREISFVKATESVLAAAEDS